MSKIRVGDVVKADKPHDENESIVGKLGKVIGVIDGLVTVEFFSPIRHGHDGGVFRGVNGRCWSVPATTLTVVYPKPEKEFRVGDLVTLKRDVRPFKAGTPGIIKEDDLGSLLVEFLEYSRSAHSGGGLGRPGHCLWVSKSLIELTYRPKEVK